MSALFGHVIRSVARSPLPTSGVTSCPLMGRCCGNHRSWAVIVLHRYPEVHDIFYHVEGRHNNRSAKCAVVVVVCGMDNATLGQLL